MQTAHAAFARLFECVSIRLILETIYLVLAASCGPLSVTAALHGTAIAVSAQGATSPCKIFFSFSCVHPDASSAISALATSFAWRYGEQHILVLGPLPPCVLSFPFHNFLPMSGMAIDRNGYALPNKALIPAPSGIYRIATIAIDIRK